VAKCVGAGLEQEMNLACAVDLCFRVAERDKLADRNNSKDLPFIAVGYPQIKREVLLILCLLQNVLPNLGQALLCRHAELLFPNLCSANNLKGFSEAGEFLVPLFQLHRGDQCIATWNKVVVRHEVRRAGGCETGFERK